jgi:hypothetical protein
MRWRNAIRDSHQTLRLQKLRFIGDPARTLGTSGETEAQRGNSRRKKGTKKKRILEMVAQQEKIAVQPSLLWRLVSKQYKAKQLFMFLAS